SRLTEVPAPPGNYAALSATEKRLCWLNFDRSNPDKTALDCLDISNKPENKPETLLEGVNGYELSGNGKKLFVRKKDDLFVLDAAMKADALKNPKTLEARLAGRAREISALG